MTNDLNAAMAVIRAAREFAKARPEDYDPESPRATDETLNALVLAVYALDADLERLPGPIEIEWQHVMPGDQLKADRGDNYYPVEHTTHFTGDLDKIRVTVNLGERGLKALERAPGRVVTVIRGPEGVAFDMLRSAGLKPTLIDEENHS